MEKFSAFDKKTSSVQLEDPRKSGKEEKAGAVVEDPEVKKGVVKKEKEGLMTEQKKGCRFVSESKGKELHWQISG